MNCSFLIKAELRLRNNFLYLGKKSMKKENLLLVLFLFSCLSIFAQKQKKYYYNVNWKNCSKGNATYYRVFSEDANGKPVGEVKDYYMSGKLQTRAEGALKIDKKDDSKSIFRGLCVSYYESGGKEAEAFYNKNGVLKSLKSWYENGNLNLETVYSNDQSDGVLKIYHKSGQLFREIKVDKGEPDYSSMMECDKYGHCEQIFRDGLSNPKNPNGWPIKPNGVNFNSEIVSKYGLYMRIKKSGVFIQTLPVKLNPYDNFSVEADVEFESGDRSGAQGLVYGYKDEENYYSFEMSPEGNFRVSVMEDGLEMDIVRWTPIDDVVTYVMGNNHLKVNRIMDKMVYSVNGQAVAETEYYDLRGNGIGFVISGKKREVLFSELLVRQDYFMERPPNADVPSGNWAGNGSGFFIDKSGYIATNYHVIEDASMIEVVTSRNGEKQRFPAVIVHTDPKNDLAVLKIKSPYFEPLDELSYNLKKETIDIGTSVFALGFPKALSYMGTDIKFTDGKISSETGFRGEARTYQISVPIQAGNSGGPLFDLDGNLVGITSSGINLALDETQNVNYAIKTSYLAKLIADMDEVLDLPKDNSVAGLPLTKKIKKLTDSVVLIKVR